MSRGPGRVCLLLLLVGSAIACSRSTDTAPTAAQTSSARLSAGPATVGESDRPGTYLGRRLAPTMSHEGAPWLTRPERDAEEDTTSMLKALRLERGDVVCDIGAGNGYHTLLFAKAVAPNGEAVAVDIQPEMIALLKERAAEAEITNVRTILGGATDPKLPAATCDLVFLADVYHELSDPAAMLGHLRKALKPGGAVALLEFRAEDPSVPIKPLHKMTKAQIDKELRANGFRLKRSYDELPWQHLVLYAPR